MKRTFFILSLCLLIFYWILPVSVIAQQKEVIKQQAETQLQNSTPEQVKAKIKELGMTEKEAEAKAAALGIDLQKYLDMKESKQENSTAPVDQTQQEITSQRVTFPDTIENLADDDTSVIPGFEGRIGSAGLKPFGYTLFQFPTSTFEPVLNMPTSPNYLLGPGDEILLTMWGETQLFIQLTVNREGNIVVPNVGPVPAQGITVEALKTRLLHRLTSFYSGLRNGNSSANTWLDVSIGKLRTIQVFVLGDVKKPGGYSISSMSTSFLALYVAGGPSINGSLRNIDVMRNNKSISRIDFYEYALRGDKSKDVRLQDGDIVFVKTVGKRIALTGNVVRPAIYELKQDETLKDALEMSGGLQVNAYFDRAHVERIIPFAERKLYEKNILDLDLKFTSAEGLLSSDFKLEDGDVISIFSINEFLQNRVTISGNVKKPGIFALKPGMKIKDLVQEADSLLSDTFGERGTLIRLLPSKRRQIIPFNLNLALQGDFAHNLELQQDDKITIYKLGSFFPEQTVSIAGAVRNPGTYIRNDQMTVSDLVVMAGGLTEDASFSSWELARMDTTKIGTLSKIITFNAPQQYWQNHWGTFGFLKDFDHLMVPSNPKFNRQRLVTVTGYVMYPGSYALQTENEKLSSIVKRAGGLRTGAYLEGSTIMRKWNDAGLVPVDFEDALDDEDSRYNISMLDGDIINIPFKQEVVLVRGEVFVPSAVVYEKGASLSYYLDQAGGLKDEADDGRIFVTMPNGKKWEEGWFIFSDPDIPGGSVITVPKTIEKENNTLPIIRDWATITVSLAAIIIGIVQITK